MINDRKAKELINEVLDLKKMGGSADKAGYRLGVQLSYLLQRESPMPLFELENFIYGDESATLISGLTRSQTDRVREIQKKIKKTFRPQEVSNV